MTCSIPDCPNIAERSGVCASHAREIRKNHANSLKPTKAKKPINKTSDKMAAALKEYAKLRREFLETNPRCAVYPDRQATEVHHMAGRNTIELLLDTDLWLAVSREAHREIELNPQWAKENGFSVLRLRKITYSQTEPHKI